ncbi:hypothetical protein BN1723_016111, partial [Verticillium longisporum]
PRHAIQQS